MAIVKANYLMRGKTAAKAARQAAKYYTFRDGPDLAQRVWHTSDRRVVLYDAVRAELAASARAYTYTYRVMLSTKEADIMAEGYHQVLTGQFERYAFIEHHNTEFPHAHVIGFRTQRMNKAELQALRGRVLEQEQVRTQSHQLDHTHVPGHAPAEHARLRPRRERGHDISGPGDR